MFRDKLNSLRLEKHLTQRDLGHLLGVSATTVYKWEHGQCEPGIETLGAMADLFGVSVDALCDRVSPEETSESIVLNRAFRQMTQEEQQKLLEVGRVLFAHAFEEPSEEVPEEDKAL